MQAFTLQSCSAVAAEARDAAQGLAWRPDDVFGYAGAPPFFFKYMGVHPTLAERLICLQGCVGF